MLNYFQVIMEFLELIRKYFGYTAYTYGWHIIEHAVECRFVSFLSINDTIKYVLHDMHGVLLTEGGKTTIRRGSIPRESSRELSLT